MPNPLGGVGGAVCGGWGQWMTQNTNCCERLFRETETPTDKQMACERRRDSRLCTVQRSDIKQGGRTDPPSLTDGLNNNHRHGMHTDEKP